MKFVLLLTINILLTSCDVPGVLKIRNKTSSDITVQIDLQQKYENAYAGEKLTIPAGDFGYLFYGFGTRWTDLFINDYTENVVDTIFLQAGAKEYYCSNINCRKQLFNLVNRKSKRKIAVTVDSGLIRSAFTER